MKLRTSFRFHLFLVLAVLGVGGLAGTGLQYTSTQQREIKILRQAEAQRLLRSILVAEWAFYSEYGEYTTYLPALGWQPPAGETNYQVGFNRAAAPSAIVQQVFPAITLIGGGAIDSMQIFLNLSKANDGHLDFGPVVDPETGEPTGERYAFWFNPSHNVQQVDFSLLASKYCGSGCTASSSGFRAVAIGNADTDSMLDVWTIDEQGTLRNLANDAAY